MISEVPEHDKHKFRPAPKCLICRRAFPGAMSRRTGPLRLKFRAYPCLRGVIRAILRQEQGTGQATAWPTE